MKKTELIEAVTQKMKIQHDRSVSKTDVSALLDSLGDVCKQALTAGKEIVLPNIGKFTVNERACRTGRNPRTGEAIVIPASKVAKFSVTKSLKDALKA